MKNIFYKICFASLVIFFAACESFDSDLQVENLENPSDQILTSDPVALEATAGKIFQNWYQTASNYYGPGMAMNTMADVSSCSWGNAGMRDLSSEPRIALNNSVSYGNDVSNSYFNSLYSVLSDANTLVVAVEKGTEFEDENLINVIGKFGQALALGYNALVFDKVWLSDETGVVGDGPVSYKEAMTFALEKLDQAIEIANQNSFTVPDAWFPGNSLDNLGLAKIMSSFGARMLVMNSRNLNEKSEIDWSRVQSYTDSGIEEDLSILHDDVNWYKDIVTYLVYPGWARIDLRIINLMDSSYEDYWPQDDTTILPPATSLDARLASDFEYLNAQNFRPERGTYHYSSYRYSRYDNYITEWTISTVEFAKAELDMYAAEAKLNMNDLQGAAEIINNGTRVNRGQLSPISANQNDIADAIHYERMVEFPLNSLGLGFFEMRKENLLQAGTLLHFPIPGKALEAVPSDYYTFGGSEGESGVDYSNGGWR